MLKRRDIKHALCVKCAVKMSTRLQDSVRTNGAPSVRYKRNELCIGRSAK